MFKILKQYLGNKITQSFALFLLILFFISPNFIKSESFMKVTQLDSSIQAVLLFSDQALLERSAQVKLRQGMNFFILPGLPERMISDSVGVNIKHSLAQQGQMPIKIRRIEVVDDHKKIYHTQKAEQAEKRLRQTESHLRTLSDRYTVLKNEEKFLREVRLAPLTTRKKFKPHINIRQWKQSLDSVRESLRKNQEKLQDLLPQIDLAREKLSIALTVARKFRSVIKQKQKNVLIVIESDVNKSLPLLLTYRVRGASWYPYYTARVFSGAKTAANQTSMELLSYALVQNNTGEQWPDIKLHFSAADPNESANLPQLYTWLIKSQLVVDRSKTRSGLSLRKEKRPRYAGGSSADVSEFRKDQKSFFSQNRYRKPAVRKYAQSEEIIQQTNRSSSFIHSNMNKIRDKRAQARSTFVQKNLRKFSYNKKAQKKYFQRGRYRQAIRKSEAVIQNINKLPAQYRNYFADDLAQARNIRRQSRVLLEQKKWMNKLVSPRQSARGYDYRYKALIGETVPSDGTFHKILISKTKLQADLAYETAPVAKKIAFLSGQVEYKAETPLLQGPLSVFHNRDYVGEANLSNISPQEKFKVYLGSDESIQVQRFTDQYRVTEGVFSTSYVYKNEMRIKIKNRKNQAVQVHVFERVPVSSDDQVKISQIETSIEPERKTKSGLYRFKVDLKPYEEKEIRIQYKLSHDSDIRPVFRSRSQYW